MNDDWFLIAPDWLCFGESSWSRTGYWIPDYLAALEALIDIYSPKQEVKLVGHSMGGNIACMYAGLRPKRVSHLINMEGFGLPETNPEDALERYVKWLNQKKSLAKFLTYKSFEKLARQIQKQARYITHERAIFIARQWAKEVNDGVVKLKADPAHKIINPILYRREEVKKLLA
jgi:pimeloyl-ACP methyl ester carboxylesterase